MTAASASIALVSRVCSVAGCSCAKLACVKSADEDEGENEQLKMYICLDPGDIVERDGVGVDVTSDFVRAAHVDGHPGIALGVDSGGASDVPVVVCQSR